MAALAAANGCDLQAAAAALEPAPTPAAAAVDARPRGTLDPQLLIAARHGDINALKDLLQLNDDDGNDDQQAGQDARPDSVGSETPTTAAAASTTTSVAAAPSTSISQPHVIVEVDPRRHHRHPPPVPVIDGESLLVQSEIVEEQVVEQPLPHNDEAAALPPAAPPAGGSSSAVLDEDGVTLEGDTLLHVVAACGDGDDFIDCAKMIVRDKKRKGGADAARLALEARNNKGDTPLHCAARAGNANMISCLIDLIAKTADDDDDEAAAAAKLAFLRMQNERGETALHQAVRAASKAAIDKLLSVDPELVDAGAACSPFFLTVSLWGEHGDMDIARHLFDKTSPSIRSNVSYYCSGPDGGNVLHTAVSRASVETVILLSQLPLPSLVLSQLASQRDEENGSTPLHLAASLLGLPSSWLLFPPQVRPPPPGTTPFWPLSTAAASKRAHKFVGRLILAGPRYWQILPLMLSLVLNANEAMAYQPDKAGMYPIHVAAGSGSLHAVYMLLERCPDCATLRDAKGRTLLHVAAEEGRWSVVTYVCRQSQLKLSPRRARRLGPDAAAAASRLARLLSSILNAQDMKGDTPLHRAVHAAQLGVVRRLIGNQQVRLDVPNNVGMRPMDVSWTTLPREAYYAWDSRISIRRSLLQVGAPYGENIRGDLFRKKCLISNQDEEKMSENLTSAAQVLALFSVLITTVTFASAFTLPGGSRSAGDAASLGGVAGTPVLGGPRRSYAFDAFILADALAFGLSLVATSILLYAGVPAGSLDNRFRILNFAYGLMWQSGKSLLAAFGLGLFIVLLPVARSIAIAVAVLMIGLACTIMKECEGLHALGDIPMTGFGRSRRQLSAREIALGCTVFVFNQFWSYLLIFGIPAIRRWPRFTLSPY